MVLTSHHHEAEVHRRTLQEGLIDSGRVEGPVKPSLGNYGEGLF